MKLLSWNVNGIRAISKKGFVDWFLEYKPGILCLQETKAEPEQVPDEIMAVQGYSKYFVSAEKKGYSGVGIISSIEPEKIETGLGIAEFDREGRVLIAHYSNLILYNIYFPNGKASAERLRYKMDFYDAVMKHSVKNAKKKPVLICGDVNTAHKEIDLARPKENEKTSGFLPEERAWIDKFLSKGFYDTFRAFNEKPEQYSWWDYKTKARERNIGWRIDYFFASNSARDIVKDAFILNEVEGSDHCPVGIEVKIDA